jgi:hypothetical protein
MTKITIDDQIEVIKAINAIWSYRPGQVKPVGKRISRKLTDKEIVEGFGEDPFSHKLWQFDENMDLELFDQIIDTIGNLKSNLDFLLSVKQQVEHDLSAKMVSFSCYEAIGEYE